MIITLTLFTLNYPYVWPYFVIRYLTGISQVIINKYHKAPILIYFPVWVDNFGLGSKTIWLTIL